MSAVDLAFWCCAALAAYAFAGYPLLAFALARRRGREPTRDDARPPLTVLVAARDEAGRIEARLRNLLASDYPADRLDIVVVDDGSRDGTAEAAASLGDSRVRVLRLSTPQGKAAALNHGMREVATAITVFADARQDFARSTLAALVAPFADARVGVVSGELRLLDSRPGAHAVAAEGTYARIERALRDAEARLGWAHAATGAVYAIRTATFRPLPPGLLLDDVWTPLQALRQGQRIWVERRAVAIDVAGSDLRCEFRRKLRTLTGNWQLIASQPWLLVPGRNPVFFAWISHKVSRLAAPWALVGALVASGLSSSPLLRLAFALQLAAYATAAIALCLPRLARRIPFAATAGSFVALNAAALASLPVWLASRDVRRLWKP